MGTSYFELLKHPLWQKKRLEILNRADFKCEDCGSGNETLHVHHAYYERGLKPWEYPSESLHCLCEACHGKAQDWLTLLHRQIGAMALSDVEVLLGFARALHTERRLDAQDEPIQVLSFQFAVGMAHYFGTNAGFILHHLSDGVIDATTLRARLAEWRASYEPGARREGNN